MNHTQGTWIFRLNSRDNSEYVISTGVSYIGVTTSGMNENLPGARNQALCNATLICAAPAMFKLLYDISENGVKEETLLLVKKFIETLEKETAK